MADSSPQRSVFPQRSRCPTILRPATQKYPHLPWQLQHNSHFRRRIHLCVLLRQGNLLPCLRGSFLPLKTQPEDYPAAVRFRIAEIDGALEVTCANITPEDQSPYRIEGGAPRFANRDAFKAKVVAVGMSPAVAEDQTRSFNATARQLRELGFSVELLNAS